MDPLTETDTFFSPISGYLFPVFLLPSNGLAASHSPFSSPVAGALVPASHTAPGFL